jgi:uncharacterized protein YjbI with pentapeptide repeats
MYDTGSPAERGDGAVNDVSCSNCGSEFRIEGRAEGFSHCDTHADYYPVPDDGFTVVIQPGEPMRVEPLAGWMSEPIGYYDRAVHRFGISLNNSEVFVLFDAASTFPAKQDEAAGLLCERLRGLPIAEGPREALIAAIRLVRTQWGPTPRLPMAKVNLAGCSHLVAADLSRADLSSADLRGADLTETNLSGATLSWVKAAGVHLQSANLSGAVLTYADLRGAILTEAILDGADLTYADLRGAQFGKGVWNVNLTGADLRGAEFDTDAYLEGSTLDQARMEGLELTGAALGSANKAWMRGINLHRARLTGALLVQSRLSSANLSEADLSGAYLTEAWLDGANLTRADLCGTDLTAADLTGAVLDQIRWNSATRWPANITPPPSS